MYELGLRRLRDDLGLVPVEYPTTRAASADPRDRARDLTAAFADPTVTAVLATIGGDDQITVVPHLDDAVLTANPKPFFGYSDNTNLLHHLHTLGVVSYHGGSVMVHLGRGGALHPLQQADLREPRLRRVLRRRLGQDLPVRLLGRVQIAGVEATFQYPQRLHFSSANFAQCTTPAH